MAKHHHPHPGVDHAHDHAHGYRAADRGRLRWALLLTGTTMVAEVIGGLWTGSLALVSDAGHMFTHLFALGVSYLAMCWADRPPDGRRSFGYHRGEVLAALLNGLTVLAVVAFIVYEAVEGILDPQPVRTSEMLIVAGVGLLVNAVTAFILFRAGRDDLNIKSALVHLAGDLGSSAAVVVGGLVMRYTGFWLLDPLLSLLIAVVILIWSWGLIRESVHILLQGTPREVDLEQVRQLLAAHPCVLGIEDLHLWSVTRKMNVLTAQLRVPGALTVEGAAAMRRELAAALLERYQVMHSTLELIPENEPTDSDCAVCRRQLPTD